MRNLVLIKFFKDFYPCNTYVASCCWSENKLYYCTKDGRLFSSEGPDVSHVCTLPVQSTSEIVFMDICLSTNQLLMCLLTGELITINLPQCNEPEVVGCIEPGLAAAAWSPGDEQFAVVTTEFNLVLLTQDLDPLYECELQGSAGEKLISVGWGKAETQFRGSAGKLKNEIVHDVVKSYDDGKVRMCWRGDGQLLVVSYLFDNMRQLKVANNEGVLLYHLEPTPGLESSLFWKPSGALIASTLRMPNKHMVCFYEKNLLRHGGFDLPEDCIVNELLWNSDSSILAVVINGKTSVQLFASSNYHWYHKYTIAFEEQEKAVSINWHKEDSYTLVIVSMLDNKLIKKSWIWRWSVNTSCGASEVDQSWAAVIDGKSLLLTAFHRGIVPPPMSTTSITTSKSINAVDFIQYGAQDSSTTSNDFFIQTVDNCIIVCRYNVVTKVHVASESIRFEGFLSQISWVAADKLMACAKSSSGVYDLVVFDLKTGNSKITSLMQLFTAAKRIPGQDKVLLYFGDNNKISDLDGNLSDEICNLAKKINELEVREKSQFFAMDSSHCLSVGNLPLSTHITSFRVTDTHLLATTMQHKLLCWKLDGLTGAASERAVERGARIVTHVNGTSSVVLQLPRGNLETIQPRALTVTTLQKLLNGLDYSKAFAIMRRERINLNLFHDHDPVLFTENVKRFIADVADPTLISNFVAELSAENVIDTQYGCYYSSAKGESCEKVERVCSLLLEELTDPSLLLPRLSCLVKKGDTENALLLIKSLREQEQNGQTLAVSSNVGLAHVLYQVDVERLFKIALGTYDLSLVMFIAGKSQKDPKEYVPFLANLQKMEENYQKFTIDNFLKRHKKALGHLVLCPSRVRECLDYIVRNGLFREALRLFSAGTDTWKSVSVLYGAELTRLGKHEEAGTILYRAGETVLAQHAFARAGAWRRQLMCAQSFTIAEDQKDLLFKSIADSLRTARRYSELARFYFDHTGDVAGGVEAHVLAQAYDEAVREAHFHNLPDLVERIVRPGAVSAAEEIQNVLVNQINEISGNLKRVEEIRQQSANGGEDWDDTASESSRGSSRLTSRSAKNSRKLERNLMKKGGPYEVVALTASLHDSATRIVALKTQVRAVNVCLLSLDEERKAEQLQCSLIDAVKEVEDMVKKVWQAPETSSHPLTSNLAAAAFTGVQQQLPGPVQALQPKVLFAPDLHSGVDWQLDILLKE